MSNKFEQGFVQFVAVFLTGLLFAAILIPAGQAGWWLYSGNWVPVSPIRGWLWVLQFSGLTPSNWLLYPESWLGLHKLLSGVHLSFFLLAFFAAIFLFMLAIKR